METTFSFGYWVQRRRKALNLTQSALAQQVGCASVTIKKIERDERRPSRLMAERLAASLMVAPADRDNFIRGALGEAPVDALTISPTPLAAGPTPPQPSEPEAEERQRFVGRERELAWLGAQLELALHGQGRMAFVAGEAGRGKSALMAEFVHRVARARAAVLVTGGTCNAYAGTGEPYLPFREALGTLTGDSEARWTPAARSAENTRRIWQALPATLQALIEHGPQLIDVFVPAKGLLARAQAASPGGATWLSQLHIEVARRQANTGRLDQSALFAQFTRVLAQLARAYPLLINLDDLHWADEASLSLVFHLVPRLPGNRVLIIGAYRPEELTLSPDRERHPLEGALAEIKRTYGEAVIDLAASDQAGGRHFVNAFVDTEPNRLDDTFRQALFQQTGGHPLFTVELLHEMQTRGDLVQDPAGHWCLGRSLDWDTLPARVEAVIAGRLDRLPAALRAVLTVASVEGELFTAEVVARVLGIEELQLLHSLSQQLGRSHRLVRAGGDVKVGNRYLSLYQFGHALFQQYLYHQLDPGEQRRLHAEVAGALEALYAGQSDEIAVQLARHFEAAHLLHQAVEYLRRAGEKAIRLSAVQEAITLLQQGLALLSSLPSTPAEGLQALRLQLALGEAQRKAGQLAEAMHTFQAAAALASQTHASEAQALAALGYEESRWRFNLPAAPSVQLLKQALSQLDASHAVLWARLHVGLAQALMPTSSPAQFAALSQRALALARRAHDPRALYDALYLIIRGDRHPSQSAARLDFLEELERLSHAVGGPEAIHEMRAFRMLEHLEQGSAEASQAGYTVWLSEVQAMQQPFYDYTAILAQTGWSLLAGRFAEAEQLAAQALRIGQRLQVEHVDGVFGIQMFTIRREQGRLAEVAPLVARFVTQKTGPAVWWPGLALIYSELGLRADAQQAFGRLAADNFAGLPRDGLWVTCLLYLAEACAFLGDAQRAAVLYEHLRPYAGRNIVVGFLSLCFGSASHFLGLLAATRSRWAEAEQHFQEALTMNARLEAWPWLAHTQHDYAAMLLLRGQPADRARAQRLLDEASENAGRFGMKALAAKVAASQAL